ncbi:hypothetical protein [Bdellovibrio reynosensis]|uniref:Lipoprotein n=1 Tax=Bdellovibrio reynosensis TaxID=2835041 RepID=A0ABY4C856_9BACT|nr:hypothetical protein [Bdellovibrio reynosensis]UOF00092.1 hypothetical protein MNR06_10300 [Bdellovibrio reynosensis]
MKKQLITYSTILAMVTSACSPQNSREGKVAKANAASFESKDWIQFQSLIKSENPNIALAEALTILMQEQNSELAVALRKKVAEGDLLIPKEVNDEWIIAKQSMITEGATAIADGELLANSLNLNLDEVQRSNAFNNQINIKVAGIAQSLAMQHLLQTFDEQIKKDGGDIASDMIDQIAKKDPKVLEKINSTQSEEDYSNKIQDIIKYLKQADYVLLKYDFAKDDQTKMVIYTAAAGAIALHLSKHPTVQNMIKVGKDLQELHEKAKKVISLAKSIEEYGKQLKKDADDMGKSAKGVFDQLSKLNVEINTSLSADGKQKARQVLDDILNGRAPTDIPKDLPPEVEEQLKKTGFFQRSREIETNVNTFINSASSASKSLENIVTATFNITNALGVKLDPGVQKAMNTAVKISQGIQVVGAVANAFKSGGFVGALTAFSGGPATMALAAFGGGLGGGGPDPAIMAELAAIKQSLEEIKAMQREILENQKRTMVMIKDLALMIEQYHREEMMALVDIREEVLNVRDGISEINEEAFRSCQAMTSFALKKSPQFTLLNKKKYEQFNASNMDLIKSTIREVNTSPRALTAFIKNGSSEHFRTCQREISMVFMTTENGKFNRALWSDRATKGSSRNGGTIATNYYMPALEYLSSIVEEKEGRWQELALHLPVLDMKTLSGKKAFYLNQSGDESNLEELNQLTATHKLEHYVTGLLILYPFLTIDMEDWTSGLDKVYVSAVSDETHERARQWLSNAFERVRMAIAQEALLAGEPLLPNLYENWQNITAEKGECDVEQKPKFCFVKMNNLMMDNLISYVLFKRLETPLAKGQEARKSELKAIYDDQKRLAQVLGVAAEKVTKDQNGRYILSFGERTKVLLPDFETVASGKIQYTEAMARMVRLEHKVADELLKISPNSYQKSLQDKLAISLFLKN